MKRMVVLLVVIASLITVCMVCTGCSAQAKGVCDGCGQLEKISEFNDHGSIQHYCDDCSRWAKLLY